MRWTAFVLGVVGTLALAGCGSSSTGVICVQDVVPGIIATVEDANDGTPVESGLAGTLFDGEHVEEMQVSGSTLRGGGVGTYDMTVEADGYQTAHVEGIEVVRVGPCGIDTVELTVALAPAA